MHYFEQGTLGCSSIVWDKNMVHTRCGTHLRWLSSSPQLLHDFEIQLSCSLVLVFARAWRCVARRAVGGRPGEALLGAAVDRIKLTQMTGCTLGARVPGGARAALIRRVLAPAGRHLRKSGGSDSLKKFAVMFVCSCTYFLLQNSQWRLSLNLR